MNRLTPVIIGAAIGCIILIMLSGCGFSENKESELTDQEGNMLHLDISELTENGFYVYDKQEETFTPVMSAASGEIPKGPSSPALGSPGTSDVRTCIWFGSKDVDLTRLIPAVDGSRTFLTLVIGQEGDMPQDYYITKFKYLGYTLGVSFTFGETGSRLFIDAHDICETSMAKDELKDVSNTLLRVYKFKSGEKSNELPTENVDAGLNKLLGLEKDKKYMVGFFDGTAYIEKDLLADTAVFEAGKSVALTEPIEPTDKNFFYVTLPTNLKDGFYYINNAGLFKYKRKGK